MSEENVIQMDPSMMQGQQGPSKEEIELQKKVWLKDHEMRKVDIITRALSVGTHKDQPDVMMFTEDQRSELEEKVFDILKNLG
tara:strand:- start:2234 stop:2482 length:249 start_codon:yes stop_codon:yes gene_type:complete